MSESMQGPSYPEREPSPLEKYPPMEDLPLKPPTYWPAVTMHFAPDTYQALVELAEGGSIADALRDAIALSKWFKDVRESGAEVLIERNRKLRRVVKIR